jgi:hypothetical protein
MILVICQPCSLCMRIMGSSEQITHLVGEQSDYWPNKFPCPRCEKPCAGYLELSVDPRTLNQVELVELNAEEAFAAFNGLGFPKEGDCRTEVLEALLREQPVRKIAGRDVFGTTRCLVEYIELWDGTRLYFGAGSEGAVVYRIVKPQSYVRKIDGPQT